MITTVTLNPAVDMFFAVDSLVPGSLHRVNEMVQQPGGKGINVAKALKSFGISSVSTGFLGGSHGRFIREQLQVMGLVERFIEVPFDTRVNVKILGSNAQLTELNGVQANVPNEKAWRHLEDELVASAKPDSWVSLCGSLPANCDVTWYNKMIHKIKARGAHVLLDASDEPLRSGILAGPDMVKPNTQELSQFVHRELTTLEEVVDAAYEIVDQGVSLVIVSMGPDGLIAVTKDAIYKVTVPPVHVVSSVGAGDTLVAGLLYGQVHRLSLAETLRFAAAAGTAAVSQIGVTQPKITHVDDILTNVKVTLLDKKEVLQ